MERDIFNARFGGVFEKSPWIAIDAWSPDLEGDEITAEKIHLVMTEVFRQADRQRQLGVIRAHPDLAGRLAVAGELTPESTAEQASAGLDQCSQAEFAEFQKLNAYYVEKFGFPYILAVRGLKRTEILENFRMRVENSLEAEFDEALRQIEKIALLRLKELIP